MIENVEKNTSEAFISKERLQQYFFKNPPKNLERGTVKTVKELISKPNYCRVDDGTADCAIVLWSENGTTYMWSSAKIISAPYDSSSLFAELNELVSVDWNMISFEKVSNANSMFYGCRQLRNCSINMKNVKNLSLCFCDCNSLENIEFLEAPESLMTANSAFENCTSLLQIDLSNWKCNELLTTENMFRGCTNLVSAKMFSSWREEEQLENIHYQDIISAVNFIGFKDSKETDEFAYQVSHSNPRITLEWLENLDKKPKRKTKLLIEPRCTKILTKSSLVNCSSMFAECANLRTVDIFNIEFFNANVTKMFDNCEDIQEFEKIIEHIFAKKDRSQYKKLEKTFEEHFYTLTIGSKPKGKKK